MPVTPTEAAVKRIFAILNYFETGRVTGDYQTLAVLNDGAGFSYGKHQATDRAGSLDRILVRYFDLGGEALDAGVLQRLAKNETTQLAPATKATERLQWPTWAQDIANTLIRLGGDPLMQKAQDQVFAEDYWEPALREGIKAGVETDLAYCMLYDTAIQSGPGRIATMRNLFPQASPARGGEEGAWVLAYLAARRNWLKGISPLVAKTTYRVDALKTLANQGIWSFAEPFSLIMPSGRVVKIP